MPPTIVHLNGSVNLPDAETVMRQVLGRIPRGAATRPGWRAGPQALFADLQALLRAVPHERIAVQWDVAVEFAMLELPEVWGYQDLASLFGVWGQRSDQAPSKPG